MTTICGISEMHMEAHRPGVNAHFPQRLARALASVMIAVLSLALSALTQIVFAQTAYAQTVTAQTATTQTATTQTVTTQTASMDKPIKLVAFGDSLTAGYMLAPDEAFPVVLGKALAAKGFKVEMINAGVSGDTTSAGLDRLAWAVPPDADGVILELGANDALRGLAPDLARRNLETIVKQLIAAKHEVLLAGMLAPRSMGDAYAKSFDAIFPDLAARYGLLLYPFFLTKTALDPKLSLSDGLHPNAKGVAAISADILPQVEELIGRIKARKLAAQKG